MGRISQCVKLGLALWALTSPTVLLGAEPFHPSTMPKIGNRGTFAGTKTDVSGLTVGLTGTAAGAVLAGYKSDTETVRGGAEATLYNRIAPAVVLVVTDKALGSGSLISKDGLILTNYHVVAGFSSVGIFLKPAREGDKPAPSQVIVADVSKVDPKLDLALLKMRSVPSAPIQPILFGDFSKINVGDDVNAIGHPEGETWTYTKGYVSQIRRNYEWKNEDGQIHSADVIQTQTPINPGNSGGPLLTNDGYLIGVNAFKAAEGEALNFAIGVDTVQSFMSSPGVSGAAAAAATKAQCKPKELFEGRTKENDGSIVQYDLSCHGHVNLAIVLPDAKDKPMYASIDMKETGTPQGVVFSTNRDGKWNFSYWDTKGTGHWDTIGYHPDGEIVPSSYGPYKSK